MAFRTAGRQLEPTAIKWLRIVAAMSNPSDLVIGGGSWPSMFGDQSEMMLTGARVTLELGDANGWSIMAGVDELLITSASSAAYKLILGGMSSQLPIPATAAQRPAIVGIAPDGYALRLHQRRLERQPGVLLPLALRSGAIPVAVGAMYTPFTADVG